MATNKAKGWTAQAAALRGEMGAVMAALTAPGAPFETTMVVHHGHGVPAFARAPASLPALFAPFCAEHADAEFLVAGDLRLTFGETYAAARALARVLVARHAVRPGDRVGIAAANSPAWVVAFMAVVVAGGCATLLNRWWTEGELRDAIALAECALVLADEARAGRLADGGAKVLTFAHTHPAAAFAGWGEADVATALPQPGAEDLATLLFTSGSSGRPRGAVSDHRAVVQAVMNFLAQAAMVLSIASRQGRPAPTRQIALVNVPLFHVTGLVPLLLQSFVMGRALVFLPQWDAREAMRLIAAERVTYYVGVPLMSHEIAIHPERAAFDLSSCAYFAAGGAARPAEHVGAIRQALPHAFALNGYGLTETNATGANNFNEACLAHPDSVGAASAPLVELAILGEDGGRLPEGQVGEIAIRSVCTIREYWRDPAATRAAFTADGFLRTGDVGQLDAAGFLTITGRAKDIIVRGGENISCLEVELVLMAHPAVAEAAVFAVPDARMGEVPLAVWHPRPGAEAPDEAELRAYLATRLAAFKLPAAFVRAHDPLPRLGSHKIDRQAVRLCYAATADTPRQQGENQPARRSDPR